MIQLTIQDILSFLNEKGFNAELQKETNQIYLIFKIEDKEFPLFIRIFEGGDLLQLLAFLPCTVVTKAKPEVARLLHLLNKELDIPGFGMDEEANVVFYRCMIAAHNHSISDKLLNAYISSIETVCRTLSPIILASALGVMTYDDIVSKSKEQLKNASKSKQKRH